MKLILAGHVLCREGDPPGPAYVICSGGVRAYKRDDTARDGIQELAQFGPGDIVGELSGLLKQTRSATVQAMQTTEVLEVPVEVLSSLARRNEPLLRVIGLALKERAGLSAAELESVATRAGMHLSRDLLTGQAAGEASNSLPVPPHDPAIAYAKALTCPACGTSFSTIAIHARKDQPVERTSDFHQQYISAYNPYDYELCVCPNDLYAALPADFGQISDVLRSRVGEVVDGVVSSEWHGERPDFNADRSLALREQGLQLALALYRMRKLSTLRVAAILHRLAWCARERGDTDAERDWLAQALAAYTEAYEYTDLDGAKEELRVLYLCGALSALLGDTTGAINWFQDALRHQQLKEHPTWERLLREQWTRARTE